MSKGEFDLTPSILNKICNDWKNEFPSLSKYKNGKFLFKIVGPSLVGIELHKFLPDTYQPLFVVFDMTAEFLFNTFISQYIHGRKTTASLRIYEHEHSREEYFKYMQDQALLNLNGEISVRDLFKAINTQIENLKSQNVSIINICESLIRFSKYLFVSEDEKLVHINKAIITAKEFYGIEHFDKFYGGFDDWRDKMVNYKKEDLESNIQANILKHKLQKLNRYDLVL